MSYISDSVAWHYDSKIKDEGSFTYLLSGSIPLNDYGEAIPSNINYNGSYLDNVLFTPFNPKERQFLPEGIRNDSLLNAFFATGSPIYTGMHVMISGTTQVYEVIQVTDLGFAGNTKQYNKAIIRDL